MKYKEIEIDANSRLKAAGVGETEIKKYAADNGLTIMTSKSNEVAHLTVSHDTRRPSIFEVFEAKQDFFDDKEMAMYFMPNQKAPTNNVYHLWEVQTI